jgi:glycosyltransferase involved in cell wall biosynthesis
MTDPVRHTIAMVAACPFPTCQGSQVLVKQSAEALARRGHRVHLVCYHFGEDIPLETSGRLSIHRIGYPRALYRKFRAGPSIQKPLLDALMVKRLLGVIRRHTVDVVHAHNYEAFLVGLAARRVTGTPVVFHTHNAISDELSAFFRAGWARGLADRLARAIDGSLPGRADHLIAINDDLLGFFRDIGVGEERMSCLPPGIAMEAWSTDPLPPQSSEGRALEDLDTWLGGEEQTAVYAGNLDDYQNLPLMFRAFARVREECPRSRLVVVSRSDPAPYQALAGELGLGQAVRFVDHTRFELALRVFERCRVGLLPRISWCGFPIKLLNYMAAGLPVVASQGSAKIVYHGQTGLVADDGDEKGFAAAIIRLLSDPEAARAMGAAGKRVVETEHTWEAHTDRLETIYRTLIREEKK